MTIEYYVFDRIEKDEYGCYWGYKGDNFCEVFHKNDETDEELFEEGYALCDAPGTETMVVEEASYATLGK